VELHLRHGGDDVADVGSARPERVVPVARRRGGSIAIGESPSLRKRDTTALIA
jgi:hypothetical protein